MILVYEDGRGIPAANTYINESDADTSLTQSDRAAWAALSDGEDYLVTASRFIDNSFQWAGLRKTLEQGLSWPRTGVLYQGHSIPGDRIPEQIKQASLMALAILLRNGLDVFVSTGEAAVKKEKFAVMEEEYFEPVRKEGESSYQDINNLLKGFYVQLSGGGVAIAPVERA